ncbi:MAG: DNA replication/repair protein RecF [Clostridiaceae bacterium]
MYISNLKLKNFRNYENAEIYFNKGVNVLTGDNAQGKTNILESIYYCSLGKSHRTNKDKELILWNKEFSYINIHVEKERTDKKIEIKIFKEGKKGIKVNSIPISKISDLIGSFNCVIFSPEDLKIVKDSPSYRRKFLDIELCKLSKRYYFNLVSYQKVLSERNYFLRMSRKLDKDLISVYDEQLSKYGSYIISERLNYIYDLNKFGSPIHYGISNKNENIEFDYIMSFKKDQNIETSVHNELKANWEKDFERKTTSIGPHKDDLLIRINGKDTRLYGSQGQQRTSILTIKFASLQIIKDRTGEYPVLLLDDVLSELDLNRQKYVLKSIKNVQTIITVTGIFDLKEYIEDDIKIFTVKDGNIL